MFLKKKDRVNQMQPGSGISSYRNHIYNFCLDTTPVKWNSIRLVITNSMAEYYFCQYIMTHKLHF